MLGLKSKEAVGMFAKLNKDREHALHKSSKHEDAVSEYEANPHKKKSKSKNRSISNPKSPSKDQINLKSAGKSGLYTKHSKNSLNEKDIEILADSLFLNIKQ